MESQDSMGIGPDLPLLPQDSVLPPQPPQLLPLRGHKPVAAKPRVQLRLLHPRAQGPPGDPSSRAICAMARAELRTSSCCLLPELPGVRGFAPRHRELLSEAVASSLSLSTKPGQVYPPLPITTASSTSQSNCVTRVGSIGMSASGSAMAVVVFVNHTGCVGSSRGVGDSRTCSR